MFRIAIGALLTALICQSAQAQPPSRAARTSLFISPAGEPFRPTPDGPPPLNAWFAGADADKDGKLVFAEFLADHERFFDIADVDKNERIAGIDVIRYEQRTAPEILGPDGPPPRPRLSEERLRDMRLAGEKPEELAAESRTGAGRFSLINEPQPLRAADRDMDFQVTKTEWAAAARRRFDRLDTNKDSALTLAELEPRLP